MVLKRVILLPMVLFMLLASLPASAADWGEVRRAEVNLNVREGRSPKTKHVKTLMKGDTVRVDFLKNDWVAVFDLDAPVRDEKRAIGYANVKYLKLVKQPAATKTQPAAKPEPAPAPAEGAGAVVADIQQTPPAPVAPQGVPVKISSDRMTYDEKKQVVSFVGNVVALHEGLTLKADQVSAFFVAGDKRFDVQGIDRIVANGNVHAEKGKTSGECGKLTYLVAKRLLIMEQDPVLRDGPNSITGEKIRFYARENRSEVVGGDGKRVEAEFFAPKGLEVQ
ncbi:LptA/OstA family protein [Salidesulfovibrio brasiliensis]